MAHIPVMLSECLAVFKEKKIKSFFDGTLGAGGFAKAFLREHPEVSTYFACDQDKHALQTAKESLGQLFREYGEESKWRIAAKAIVTARRKKKIETTTELSQIITASLGKSSRKKLHPATLIFQGLRIAVNKELDSIQDGITKAIHFLTSGQRMAVLSFHSLEDRIVKNIFRSAAAKPIKRLQEVRDSHY